MNDYPMTLFPFRRLVSERDDFARDLVAKNSAIRSPAIGRASDVEISLAHARREHAQQRLSRSGRRHWNAGHREIARRSQNRSAHRATVS